jgi:hypothetical protein
MIRGTARDAARIKEFSTTGGTGNLTLSGALAKFRMFSSIVVNNDDSFFYAIINQHATRHEFEVGEGHLSSSNTFVRDTVFSSSNGGALVNFTVGDTLYIDLIQQNQHEKALDLALWGDGSDGAASPSSGSVVMSDHLYHTSYTPSGTSSLDVSSSLYWLHCNDTLNLTNAPTGAIIGDGHGPSSAGAAGHNGGAGGGGGSTSGTVGGGGKANGIGGTGGGGGGSVTPWRLRRVPFGFSGLLWHTGTPILGGGAGAQGAATTGTGGSGGGVVCIAARRIRRAATTGTSAIRCRGATSPAGSAGADRGGGGGGGGGWILIFYEQLLGSLATNALDVNDGAGGAGIQAGEGGGGGAAGRITLVNVHTGVITEVGSVDGNDGNLGTSGTGGAGGVR